MGHQGTAINVGTGWGLIERPVQERALARHLPNRSLRLGFRECSCFLVHENTRPHENTEFVYQAAVGITPLLFVPNPELLRPIGQLVQGVFCVHAHLFPIRAEVPELHAAVRACLRWGILRPFRSRLR